MIKPTNKIQQQQAPSTPRMMASRGVSVGDESPTCAPGGMMLESVVVVVGSETDTVGDAVSPSSDAVVSGTLVVVVGTPVLVDATLAVLVTSGAAIHVHTRINNTLTLQQHL